MFSQLPSDLQPRLEMVRRAWDNAAKDADAREKRLNLACIAARNEPSAATPRGDSWFQDSADLGLDRAVDAGQPEDEAAHLLQWYISTLSANHWLSLNDVKPGQAAMVMCHFHPNKETPELAKQITTDATGPMDFEELLQRFEDLANFTPQHRTLLHWLEFARTSKLRYHPWIDRYVEAARLTVGNPAGATPAVGVEAPAAVVVTAPPPIPETKADAEPNWKDQARAEALLLRAEGKAVGRFPPLGHLGDEVARLFRERRITGPNGHALTGAYIKRHALQGHGITTDAERLKARLKTRGK